MADDGSSTVHWPSNSDLYSAYDPYNASVAEAELGRDSPSNPAPAVSSKLNSYQSRFASDSKPPPWVDEKSETMSTTFSDANLVEPSFDETVLRALCDLDVSEAASLYSSACTVSSWLYVVRCAITAR